MTNKRFDDSSTARRANRSRRSRGGRWTSPARSRPSPRKSCCGWRVRRFLPRGQRNACLAGGVALNCVANGRLLREGPFDRLWIQPACRRRRRGGGAASCLASDSRQPAATPPAARDGMRGALSGSRVLRRGDRAIPAAPRLSLSLRPGSCALGTTDRRARGRRQGCRPVRRAHGVRPAGSRPSLHPRRPALAVMQSIMNLKIKYRESFRPFAPAVLAERASDYFDLDLSVALHDACCPGPRTLARGNGRPPTDDLREWVNEERSKIPAVTHVDYSARPQTVSHDQSPEFHAILSAFEASPAAPS